MYESNNTAGGIQIRLPKVGPTLREVLKRLLTDHDFSAVRVQELVDKANAEYMGWHKFRFQRMPEGVTPEQAWAALKISRGFNGRPFGMQDLQGKRFTYWLPNALLGHLHEIDKHGGGEIGAASCAARGAFKERFLVSSLMADAIASSHIEGAATTTKVAKEMLRTRRSPRSRDEQMILNNYRTIVRVKELTAEPLTVELLCEIQAGMTEGTLHDSSAMGRLRNASEDDTAVYRQDTLLHRPPPAATLHSRLEALCAYANKTQDASGRDFVHPVVRAVLLHFRLGYEHPFVDGNGRTARAIFHWYMLKHGYRLFEYLPVSAIIRNTVTQYMTAYWLAEHDENDATYFVAYHLRAIGLALREMLSRLERKQREMDLRVTAAAKGVPLKYRQRSLLVHALKNPGAVYTVVSHGTSHAVSPLTARKDLCALRKLRLLEESRQGKRHIWIAPNDLEERLKRLGESHTTRRSKIR